MRRGRHEPEPSVGPPPPPPSHRARTGTPLCARWITSTYRAPDASCGAAADALLLLEEPGPVEPGLEARLEEPATS